MRPDKAAILAWEERWARAVAIATFVALLLIIAAIVVASQGVGSGGGESELLRHVDAHRTAQVISGILQTFGIALLAAPLYYLFRAARARSETMRGQLVGVVVAGPLFIAVSAILTVFLTLHAADEFVSSHVPTLIERQVALNSDRADEVAAKVVEDASLRSLVGVLGLVGALSFLVGMAYTSLHAMRSGLLTRFWGALGIALGVVSILPFPPFYLAWFIYLALLLMGWIPGGRPPAWSSGEAEPWPTSGERAAAAIGSEPSTDGDPEEVSEPPQVVEPGERRKRKQRD